ncbi:NAD-dependent protein deacetylase sirtuin-2 [Mortierella sp. AM989]|nr:NAD-dependent protein deacetylase sirtuin-2 [Mortierella sp. AM989]
MSSAVAPRIPLKSRPLKPKPEPEPRIQILKDGTISAIADLIASGKAKNIIVMTGAGISTAAGIKDFRSPGTGLYDDLEKYNLPFPEAVFDLEFFKETPLPFYHLAKHMYPGQYQPTLTHYLLPLLAKKNLLLRSYTQNIDSLERLAGLDEDLLVEAHGSFAYSKCVQCEMTSDAEWVKRLVKPSITFFGETVPMRFSTMADKDFEKCDLLIVLGTSLKVEPFNKLISKVSPRCPRLLINREKAGQDLHSGFDFEDKLRYTIQRDALFLGNCDDGVRKLATLCGWEDEIQAMYVAGHQKLKLKKEEECSEAKVKDDEDEDDEDAEKDDLDNEDEPEKEPRIECSDSSNSLDDITSRLEKSIFFPQSQDSQTPSESGSELGPKLSQSTDVDVGSTANEEIQSPASPILHPTVDGTDAVKESDGKEVETRGEKLGSDGGGSETWPSSSEKDKIPVIGPVQDESDTRATEENSESRTVSCTIPNKEELVEEEEAAKIRDGRKIESRCKESGTESKGEETETVKESIATDGTTKLRSEPSVSSEVVGMKPIGLYMYSPMASLTDVESSSTLVTSLATSRTYTQLTIATATASSQQGMSTCFPVTAVCTSIGADNGGSVDMNGIHLGGRLEGIGGQMNRTKRRKEFESVYVTGGMKGGFRQRESKNILGAHNTVCGRVTKKRRFYELDQWNEGVIAFDQGLYEDALEIFEPIADSAKINFNIGVSAAYEQATKLDQYLAIAYFQNGVANVALEDYARALECFHDAFLYLRGNMVIDYTQLNLDFKLYSCQVLYNRALCYIEVGQMDLAMTDLWRASREKQTSDHDMLDQALRDKGRNCTVFTVPQGVLYRPPESKVKNSKKKDYLGNSKVIAAIDASDSFAGFNGKSAWQVQMSGPTNVAAVEEPRPMTAPIGLQRRATDRVGPGLGGNGRARRGTDPERPQLEHSASYNGMDSPSRRAQGPGPSSLGPAGSEPRMSLLSRRNTDAQRPSPLNLNGNSNYAGPTSAAPSSTETNSAPIPPVPRSKYQDELDDLEKHVYALSIEAQEITVGDRFIGTITQASSSSTDLRVSPIPTRTNSSNSTRPGVLRNGSNYGTSPPSRVGTPPAFSDLRRVGSNSKLGLQREDSVRSSSSGGSGGSMGNGIYQQPNGNYSGYMYGNEGTYLDEPAYAGLRDKLRVKCHYIDTRAVLVRVDTPIQELIQKIQDKFQSERPLKLKYRDEDSHMLSMIDDEDWLMAQQVHMETTGNLDRMELWCFDEEI